MSDKHFFGSSETERKLNCLRAYLSAYSTALKGQNFCRVYIDAFAGTGSRTETKAMLPFFDQDMQDVQEVTTPGSARIALETDPPFHSVVLIEQDPKKVAALKSVVDEYPGNRAHVREGDANEIVKRICSRYDWHREKMRGVIFLDPYGMEVAWETVEAIANTQALDCWYFFPLSGLYRNAPLDPLKLDQVKITSITRVFGTDSWRRDWYEERGPSDDLFGNLAAGETRAASVDRIEQWVHDRLKTVFKGTVLKPLRLRHSKSNAPMASLFFAVGNPKPAAVKVASKIATHILNVGISSQVRSR
ncbi:three-Cys-motif partner protein TcmP [Affinirhizobium pseudoryzae]|uniref:three-Cys-motif partner protein TcmP n=1 Tax=Allorhizobium pseudoryzae TaxID=379684 RepID=UPI0013EDACBC|nr:three-Cys-motif partner protein TcmP [Allorhizobium pseudoryzae]